MSFGLHLRGQRVAEGRHSRHGVALLCHCIALHAPGHRTGAPAPTGAPAGGQAPWWGSRSTSSQMRTAPAGTRVFDRAPRPQELSAPLPAMNARHKAHTAYALQRALEAHGRCVHGV